MKPQRVSVPRGWRQWSDERVAAEEYLDQTWLPAREREASLADLGWVNRTTGGNGAVRWLARVVAPMLPPRPEILDLASGDGRLAALVRRDLARRGVAARVTLADRNPAHLERAAQRSRDVGEPLPRLLCADALALPVKRPFDVTMTSLFLHHLDDAELTRLATALHDAAPLWCVHEVERRRHGALLIRALLPLFVRSPATVADGAISVQQGFRLEELVRLGESCGWRVVAARRRPMLRLAIVFARR